MKGMLERSRQSIGIRDAPYDRPNLSKDYLAGSRRGVAAASVCRILPRSRHRSTPGTTGSSDRCQGQASFPERRCRVVLRRVAPGDRVRPHSTPAGGQAAGGATCVRRATAATSSQRPGRHVARWCRGELHRAEVAASLRNRGLEVHVVAPEQLPLERVLGPELGEVGPAIRTRRRGVVFHMGRTAAAVEEKLVRLDNGEAVEAGLVVAGVGVRLSSQLAADAGLAGEKGVDVDQFLETSAPGFYAAATSPFGPIHIPASAFTSSTGWLHSGRGRPPLATFWARRSRSMPSRSSGAATMTCPFLMWDTLRAGQDRHLRQGGKPGCNRDVLSRRPATGGGDDRPRPRQSHGRSCAGRNPIAFEPSPCDEMNWALYPGADVSLFSVVCPDPLKSSGDFLRCPTLFWCAHHAANLSWFHRSSVFLHRCSPNSSGPVSHLGLPGAFGRAHAANATEEWSLTLRGTVAKPTSWTWEQFLALPSETFTVDIHCVTKWSKLDTRWGGVSIDPLLASRGASGSYVTAWSEGGYTTNLPLADLTGGKAWIAHTYDGKPLDPEHGGPARLLVPHLYFWKSAKWVRGLELRDEDEPGFWESNGYHIRGDPWQEQRY